MAAMSWEGSPSFSQTAPAAMRQPKAGTYTSTYGGTRRRPQPGDDDYRAGTVRKSMNDNPLINKVIDIHSVTGLRDHLTCMPGHTKAWGLTASLDGTTKGSWQAIRAA